LNRIALKYGWDGYAEKAEDYEPPKDLCGQLSAVKHVNKTGIKSQQAELQ
jgi:hypothetical protein